MIALAVRGLVWALRRAPRLARKGVRRGGKYRAGMLWAEALGAVVLTVLIHELGHASIAAFVFRLPVAPILSWKGPGIRIGSDDRRLTRFQIACTAAAGPAANLAPSAASRTGLGSASSSRSGSSSPSST